MADETPEIEWKYSPLQQWTAEVRGHSLRIFDHVEGEDNFRLHIKDPDGDDLYIADTPDLDTAKWHAGHRMTPPKFNEAVPVATSTRSMEDLRETWLMWSAELLCALEDLDAGKIAEVKKQLLATVQDIDDAASELNGEIDRIVSGSLILKDAPNTATITPRSASRVDLDAVGGFVFECEIVNDIGEIWQSVAPTMDKAKAIIQEQIEHLRCGAPLMFLGAKQVFYDNKKNGVVLTQEQLDELLADDIRGVHFDFGLRDGENRKVGFIVQGPLCFVGDGDDPADQQEDGQALERVGAAITRDRKWHGASTRDLEVDDPQLLAIINERLARAFKESAQSWGP